MTGRIPCLLAAMWLGGCTTLADIRAWTPQMTEMIAAAPVPVGECVQNKLLLQHPQWFLLTSRDGGAFHIAAEQNIGGATHGQLYIWAIAFVPDQTQTRVEVRTRLNIWREPMHPRDLWQIIRSCA